MVEVVRCDACGHDVALHRSTGCLWRLGECPCMHDLRTQYPEPKGNR